MPKPVDDTPINRSGSDRVAQFASIDIVALTVISACVGINAANMPRSGETSFKAIMLMIFLTFFYRTMKEFGAMVAERDFPRSAIYLGLMAPAGIISAWSVGDFTGNIYLGGGLLCGWLLTYLFNELGFA